MSLWIVELTLAVCLQSGKSNDYELLLASCNSGNDIRAYVQYP